MELLAIKPLWKGKAGNSVAFSGDSQLLALAGRRGPARVVKTGSWAVISECEGLKVYISQLAFSPDGAQLAIGQMYDRVTICQTSTGELLAKGVFGNTKKNHLEELSGLAYSIQTGELLRSAWKPTVDLISPINASLAGEFRPSGGTRSVDAFTFNRDGSILVVVWKGKAPRFKQVMFWEWKKRKLLHGFHFESDFTRDISLSTDETVVAVPFHQVVAAGALDGVLILDARTGEKIIAWNTPRVYQAVFVPNSHLLAASCGGSIYIGDAHSSGPKACLQVLKGVREIEQIAISADGQFFAAGTASGAFVWSLPDIRTRAGL